MENVIISSELDMEIYQPHEENGSSGQLLLATSIKNPLQKYVIKHGKAECACSEYMYSRVASALGFIVPEVWFVSVFPNDNTPFKFPACAIEYIADATITPRNEIDEAITLPYTLLGNIVRDDDDEQYLKTKGGVVYKIDHAWVFGLEDSLLVSALLNFDQLPQVMKDHFRDMIERIIDAPFLTSTFSDETISLFCEMCKKFSELDIHMFDDDLRLLAQFYSVEIAQYFYKFIIGRQKLCREFLKQAV